jgi:hypothetical protein
MIIVSIICIAISFLCFATFLSYEKLKNKPQSRRRYLISSIVWLVFSISFFAMSQIPSSSSDSSVESNRDTITAGQDAYTNTDALVTFNESDMSTLDNFVIANNRDAIDRMETNGQVIVLPENTKVTVLDYVGITLYKIEIVDGAYQGQIGYIATESLKSSP